VDDGASFIEPLRELHDRFYGCLGQATAKRWPLGRATPSDSESRGRRVIYIHRAAEKMCFGSLLRPSALRSV
jgi:hypothetical protein